MTSKIIKKKFELKYCPICIQATNHGCCKCAVKKGRRDALKEKKLGRKLNSCEVIHHIDGNPHNNKLSNLKLFPNKSEHIVFHRRKNKNDKTK